MPKKQPLRFSDLLFGIFGIHVNIDNRQKATNHVGLQIEVTRDQIRRDGLEHGFVRRARTSAGACFEKVPMTGGSAHESSRDQTRISLAYCTIRVVASVRVFFRPRMILTHLLEWSCLRASMMHCSALVGPVAPKGDGVVLKRASGPSDFLAAR